MAELTLTNGDITLIDDQDLVWASQYRWHSCGTKGQYVATMVVVDGRRTPRYLHRMVLNAPDGYEVDHRNGDKRDNRRSNLRLATPSQNQQNRQPDWSERHNHTTGRRNVYFMPNHRGTKHFRVRMRIDGRKQSFGYFHTAEEADAAAREARGRYMTHAPECHPEGAQR